MLSPRYTRRQWLEISCIAGAGTLWGTSGCGPSDDAQAPSSIPIPAEPVRVLVVEDPALEAAIKREWTEEEVAVQSVAREPLATASRLPGDVIVFPAALLGLLAERSLIHPLGDALLASEAVALQDIFPLTRREEIRWGGRTYALPLGSPQFVLAYRPDLLRQLQLDVPTTWEQFQAAADKLADRSQLADAAPPEGQPWRAAVEPLGPGFGGALLLARAAPYAAHREQTTPLFETPGLDPLIDGPPFVRALTELVASRKTSDLAPVDSPAAAMDELLAGRCAMAIGWPSSQPPLPPGARLPPVAFAELPSSKEVFHHRHGRWEQRGEEAERVPLLGSAGRLAAVVASSSNVSVAEGLVRSLSDSAVSSRIGPASPATTLFRDSHRAKLQQWVGSLPPDAAESYFHVVQQAQSRASSMSTVRLPGSDRYLTALDAAVTRAATEGQDPQESLRQAAADWRKITAELGVEAQRAALSNSIGGGLE